MRAVVYKGPFKVDIEEVPDPRIEHPSDAIIKITSTWGFSSSGTRTNVKHVKWFVEGFEQIVHHFFPVADTTD